MTPKKPARPIEILLVEDNLGDIVLTKEAFSDAKIWNNLHVAKDGEEALDFLNKGEGFEDAVRPDLILLDLNLPKVDGRVVLEQIKSTPNLKRIPVVMLTSSEAEKDIIRTYDLHANSYIVKPIDLEQFVKVIQTVKEFWFSVVSLPDEK